MENLSKMGVIGYKTTATHEEMKMNFIKAFFFFHVW